MAAPKNQPTSVDKLKSYESQISTVFGFIIVVAIGVGLLFLLRRTTMTPAPSISDLGSQTAEDLMADKDNEGKYTVKAGDNLWKIAESEMKDGYQWPTITKANSIAAPYVVTEGQTLTIPTPDPEIKSPLAQASVSPTPTAAPATAAPTPTAVPTASPAVAASASPAPVSTTSPSASPSTTPANAEHTVVAGESLWKIAVAEYNDGYKWVEIYRANKELIGSNPGIIVAGQKLTMPSGK